MSSGNTSFWTIIKPLVIRALAIEYRDESGRADVQSTLPEVWQVVEKVIIPFPADVDICREQAKRGNLKLIWVSNLEIPTVACGDLVMTIAAFFNSLSDEPVEKNSVTTGSDFFAWPCSEHQCGAPIGGTPL